MRAAAVWWPTPRRYARRRSSTVSTSCRIPLLRGTASSFTPDSRCAVRDRPPYRGMNGALGGAASRVVPIPDASATKEADSFDNRSASSNSLVLSAGRSAVSAATPRFGRVRPHSSAARHSAVFNESAGDSGTYRIRGRPKRCSQSGSLVTTTSCSTALEASAAAQTSRAMATTSACRVPFVNPTSRVFAVRSRFKGTISDQPVEALSPVTAGNPA